MFRQISVGESPCQLVTVVACCTMYSPLLQVTFTCFYLQLLQIRRTEEAKWESKNVMSVSFATLIAPPTEETSKVLDLR